MNADEQNNAAIAHCSVKYHSKRNIVNIIREAFFIFSIFSLCLALSGFKTKDFFRCSLFNMRMYANVTRFFSRKWDFLPAFVEKYEKVCVNWMDLFFSIFAQFSIISGWFEAVYFLCLLYVVDLMRSIVPLSFALTFIFIPFGVFLVDFDDWY